MPASGRSERGTGLAAIVLCAWITMAASAASLAFHPIAAAVKRGDCDAAIDLVKHGVASNDSQAALLGGRMLDEGVCVVQNPGEAAQFFEMAAKLGDREAALEYAAGMRLSLVRASSEWSGGAGLARRCSAT
jgi:TPR repeat protein